MRHLTFLLSTIFVFSPLLSIAQNAGSAFDYAGREDRIIIHDNTLLSGGTGKISITNNQGTATGADNFVLNIPTTTFTFNPTDDGQVKLTIKGANYGAKSTTKIERNKFVSYFKFDASSLTGIVQSATLRLRVANGASDGGDSGGSIFPVSNNYKNSPSPWVESGLTAGNAPQSSGPPLQILGPVLPGAVVDFDVTAAVTGATTYSFCIQNSEVDQVKYYTKDGSTVPELIVVTSNNPQNLPPVAIDDAITTGTGLAVVINILANDYDPDGNINPATVNIITNPTNGTAVVNAVSGIVTYTSNSGFSGTDTFTYSVQDDQGATSNVATVTVTVTGSGGGQTLTFTSAHDAQVKVTIPGSNFGAKSTMKLKTGKFASYIKFNVSGVTGTVQNATVRLKVGNGPGDGGASGGSIYLVSNNYQGGGTAWVESLLTSGNAPVPAGAALSSQGAVIPSQIVDFDVTAAVSANGIVSFQLGPDSGDQIKYFTKEGSTAPQLIVTFGSSGGGNLPPVAVDDNASTSQDTAIPIAVTDNDSDPDGNIDPTTVAIVSNPANGSTQVHPVSGVVTYTPVNGFSGFDSFTYTVNDDQGATSNIATVSVTVSGSGGGQTLTFQSLHDGQVKLTNGRINYGSKSTMKIEAARFVSYMKFTVTGLTGNVQSAVVRLQVGNGIADGGDNGGSIFQSSNNFSNSGNPWMESSLNANNAPGQIGSSLSTVGAVSPLDIVDFDVTSVVMGNDTYSFCLQPNSGNQVKYYTKEGSTAPQLIIVTDSGGSQNVPPVAVNDTVATNEDVAVVIDVTANDTDPDGFINVSTVTVVTAPVNGNVVVNVSTGKITYTPTQNYFGADSLKYTVQDDLGALSNQAVVFITVNSVNDPPVAADDQAGTDGVSNVVLDILQNDTDVDGTLDSTTVTIIASPTKGSASVNPLSGIVTYVPNSGFSGSDIFTYTVDDDSGSTSNIATVTIDEVGVQNYSFNSIEDAQIKVTAPGFNFGSKSTMKLETGKFLPYMKFVVSGISGSVQSAKLRLYVAGPSDDGGTVYQVSNDYKGTSTSWDEDGITGGNAPVISGSPLGSFGAVTLGNIVELDVLGAISGNGIYSFAIKSNSIDQAKYATHENIKPAPELLITSSGTAPPELLTLTNPNGGEVWTLGNSQTVTWTSSGAISNVKLELSTDGGNTWSVLVNSTANDGNESVQAGNISSNNCLVRISDAADGTPSDVSDTVFSITAVLGTMDIVVNTDDEYELYVNGLLIGSDNQWNVAQNYTAPLVSGENVVAVKGINAGGAAGLILEVRVNGNLVLLSDNAWRVSLNGSTGWQTPGFDDSGWNAATSFGQYGVAPWNFKIANFPSTSSAHWIWSSDSNNPLVYLRGSFNAGPPSITSFNPTSGLVGSEITILGNNFATTVGGTSSQATIRIMPLGNSITKGVTGSTDNAGYRNDLASLLDGVGISYDFVGSQQNGTGFDNDHEGHNGYWADEILAEINNYLNANPPDIILFHIGTNDISSQQSNESTINEIGQNLDRIRTFSSNIITILAGIIPRKDSKDGTTTKLVNLIQNLVSQRQQAGELVYYAPMNGTFKANPNWKNDYYPANDNIHPNDTGYGVMANVWFNEIITVLGNSATTVAFNGVPAPGVTIDSNTQLRVNVPTNATTGKITVSNNYGSTQSTNNFTVSASSVAALDFTNLKNTPTWQSGSTHTLLWKTLGEIEKVKIEFSTDDGSTWQTLAAHSPNSGRYVWSAPTEQADNYRFRISDADRYSIHGVSEGEVHVVAPQTLPAIPNIFELRDALFANKNSSSDKLRRTDLNSDGKVNLVDFLDLLDLGNVELEELRLGNSVGTDIEETGSLLVVMPTVSANAGSKVFIPIKVEGEQPIRGFQFTIRYDSSMIDLSVDDLPYKNEFGMRIEAIKKSNGITIIGYLEKQNSAVSVNGTLLELEGRLNSGFDGYVDIGVVDVLFVSKNRLPLANTEISIEAGDPAIPAEFGLFQNYPNPFNPSTQINFDLPRKEKVQIHIYNVKGELVTTLLNEVKKPGRHKITWNGRDARGVRVASGIYVYQVKAGKWKDSKMMTLVK